MKILIVDDNRDNLYLLETMLKAEGYKVVPTSNGAEALEKLRAESFDMVIADILMPVMDGFQLCRECKTDEKLKHIPFVFYTATYVDEKDEELALALGADKFIRKPIEPDEFMSIIREFVKHIETARPVPKGPAVEEEAEVLKLYSERLVHKLEKKMLDLEKEVERRQRLEEELRRAEEKYRLITENTRDIIVTTDMDLNITYVSPSVQYLGTRTPEEIVATPLETLLAPASFETVRRAFAEELPLAESPTRDPARSRVLEVEIVRKDGTAVPVEARVNFLRDAGGKPTGLIAVLRDITERKKAEEKRKLLELQAQAASRLASIGEMAAGIAHEINNPLTGVIGYAQLLLSRPDVPPDIKADLTVINDCAQRVADIVRRLLTFARQTKPERKLVDVNMLVQSTLTLRAYSLKMNNIAVTTHLDPRLPATVADPGQIQQVLFNLIANAETEMRLAHGKGNLTITTERVDNTIRIAVKDDGPGIAPEIMGRIFDPFFTTREAGQGTGLGLSICYGIVTEHNGRIYAESKPGEGATFIVELPVVTPPEPAQKVAEKPSKSAKATILVVDDEQVVRDLTVHALTEQGHRVDTTDSASEALKKIKRRKYDLLLIDIKLPDRSGVELYRQVKEMDSSLAQKVLFITGDIMSPDTRRFLAETGAAYIEKPFDVEQLSREVQRALTTNKRLKA